MDETGIIFRLTIKIYHHEQKRENNRSNRRYHWCDHRHGIGVLHRPFYMGVSDHVIPFPDRIYDVGRPDRGRGH